jgi:methyl-accepting chemotaxis protein
MKSHNRRKMRNYLVMSKLQFTIAAANLCYILTVAGIILLVFMNPFYTDILETQSPCDQHAYASVFMLLVERFIPAAILIGVVAFFHQLLLTHKICGPLVNFNHTFQRLANKDLTRKIHLRRNDFLKAEAQLINQGVDAVNNGICAVHKSNQQVLEALKMMGEHGLSNSERQAVIEKVHRSVVQTQDLLGQFRLKE